MENIRMTIVYTVFGLFLWTGFGYAQTIKQSQNDLKPDKNFYIGIDNSGDQCKPDEFFNPAAMDAFGVDFVVYHYRGPNGTIEEEAKRVEKLVSSFDEKGLKVVVNVESGCLTIMLPGSI